MSQVDYLVDDIKDLIADHPTITKAVTITVGAVAGATVAYFAWPLIAGGALYTGAVEVGSVIGSVLASLWSSYVGI